MNSWFPFSFHHSCDMSGFFCPAFGKNGEGSEVYICEWKGRRKVVLVLVQSNNQ